MCVLYDERPLTDYLYTYTEKMLNFIARRRQQLFWQVYKTSKFAKLIAV